MASQGVIKYGIGAGLVFDATGGFPGYVFGTTEPEEQETLAKHLHTGDVFYDIGANIGFYSTIAARIVGENGRVYAFEPFPASAAAARKNASLNGFTHVEVIEAAVAKQAGTLHLEIADNSAKHKMSENTSKESIPVQTIAIDQYIAEKQIALPSLVMIDVEGAEMEVLEGMWQTICQHRPIILCEVHWILAELVAFRERLKPLGYEVTTLSGGDLPATPERFHALMLPRTKA